MLNNYGIIGIISSYNSNFNVERVNELKIKNQDKAFKMVGLSKDILDKNINELSLSEQFKLDLATKLDKDIIIIGNLSKNLIYKDIEYIKKLLIKLNNDYHKKIIVIDEDVNIFFNLVKYMYVIRNKKVIYKTDNFYSDELYKYCKMPKIIEFIKYVNEDKKRLNENIDIYELIKDMYRSLS